MSSTVLHIDEEWCSVDLESKVNRKLDALQALVVEQRQALLMMSDEIAQLKQELHSAKNQAHSQNDRTHQLLEELKVMKQRELNLALRSHVPVPFTTVSSPLFTSKNMTLHTLRSPMFKGKTAEELHTKLPPFPALGDL